MKTYFTKPNDNETLAFIPCPLCKNEKFKPYWDCTTHKYVKCSRCKVVLQNPQPIFDDLQNRYDERYFDYEINNENNFYNLARKGLDDIQFESLFDFSEGKKTFLDIGCATGKLISELQKTDNWTVKGVEICEESADYGIKNNHVDIYKGTLESAQFADNSYDVIFNAHVIEHLNDPHSFVTEIARILKPGGFYICITPNLASLQAIVFKSKWRSSITDHTFLFTKNRLKSLISAANLTVIKEQTWGGWAVGAKFKFLKPVLDPLAKTYGFGDVIMLLTQK